MLPKHFKCTRLVSVYSILGLLHLPTFSQDGSDCMHSSRFHQSKKLQSCLFMPRVHHVSLQGCLTRLISIHCIVGLLPLPTSSQDGSDGMLWSRFLCTNSCTISLYQFIVPIQYQLLFPPLSVPNESYQFMFPPLSVPNESYKLIYQFSVLVSHHPALSIQRDGNWLLGLLCLPHACIIARLNGISLLHGMHQTNFSTLHTWTTVSANLFLGGSDCMPWSSCHCSKKLQVRH